MEEASNHQNSWNILALPIVSISFATKFMETVGEKPLVSIISMISGTMASEDLEIFKNAEIHGKYWFYQWFPSVLLPNSWKLLVKPLVSIVSMISGTMASKGSLRVQNTKYHGDVRKTNSFHDFHDVWNSVLESQNPQAIIPEIMETMETNGFSPTVSMNLVAKLMETIGKTKIFHVFFFAFLMSPNPQRP